MCRCFRDYQVSLGDAPHEALTACPSHPEALLHWLGTMPFPDTSVLSVWKHCSWKGETQGDVSMPQLLHLTIQHLSAKSAALKEDGGLCLVQLKGRDTFLNTLRGDYVTSKEIISSNLLFLLPAFSLAAIDWLEGKLKTQTILNCREGKEGVKEKKVSPQMGCYNCSQLCL